MSISFVLLFRHFELNSISITVPGIPYEYPASILCAMVLEILLNHVSCNNDFALGANLAPSDDAFRDRPTSIYQISGFSILTSVLPEAGKLLLSAFRLLPAVLSLQPLRHVLAGFFLPGLIEIFGSPRDTKLF
jgi:hypothetical protein